MANKFGSGYGNHASFIAIKEQLTLALATEFEKQLEAMKGSAKGISWFSSCAEQFAGSVVKRAA